MNDISISDYFSSVQKESDAFRVALPSILESEKDEDNVTEQMIMRDEFCTKAQKLYNHLSDKIDEMKSLQRKLKEIMREQRTDSSKLEKLKWFLVRLRKHGA